MLARRIAILEHPRDVGIGLDPRQGPEVDFHAFTPIVGSEILKTATASTVHLSRAGLVWSRQRSAALVVELLAAPSLAPPAAPASVKGTLIHSAWLAGPANRRTIPALSGDHRGRCRIGRRVHGATGRRVT